MKIKKKDTKPLNNKSNKNTNIDYETLSEENLDIAIKIQNQIFPLENGSEDLKESLFKTSENYLYLKYWLPKIDDEYIGICGLYVNKFAPKDVWVGWFGVLPEFQRKGYGMAILKFLEETGKELGYETIRLYSDEVKYAIAGKLYEKFGMINELYDCPDDKWFKYSNTLIYSKSLTNKPVKLWGNKNLYLGAHDAKNKK